ncbi:replication protein [uncultured Thiothrix sp.]|uniref:replication protein n=1 Tax=uncultured Thiothrix sp. TaxID=223185 RepID=UPI002618242F|nr:replication protein [uncultured Thiothrix sp.]HMT95010.1 replication protein [Thiolinea sp.]
MSTLARDLIDAALVADLSKNEYKVFLALFRQTLCYGKAADPLTLKRLADLTGIRKDRLAQAVHGVVAAGLFEANSHKIFDTLYTIGRGFFAASAPFFAPHLPVNGNPTRTTETVSEIREDLPESRVHTYNYLTALTNTPLTTTDPHPSAEIDSKAQVVVSSELNSLPYPASFTAAERQQAARCLDGLHPELASDCLKILTLSLEAGRVKSPLGYLNQLGKAARAGSLDRSLLAPPNAQIQAVNSNPHAEQRYRLQTLAADIQALDRLQALAGLPMEASTQAHRQALISEFNALKVQLQGGQV